MAVGELQGLLQTPDARAQPCHWVCCGSSWDRKGCRSDLSKPDYLLAVYNQRKCFPSPFPACRNSKAPLKIMVTTSGKPSVVDGMQKALSELPSR